MKKLIYTFLLCTPLISFSQNSTSIGFDSLITITDVLNDPPFFAKPISYCGRTNVEDTTEKYVVPKGVVAKVEYKILKTFPYSSQPSACLCINNVSFSIFDYSSSESSPEGTFWLKEGDFVSVYSYSNKSSLVSVFFSIIEFKKD